MTLGKKYLTGVFWQDFQHTKLIKLLERLKKSKSEGNDEKLFDHAVAFLAMYVNEHFNLEQAYMKEYNYATSEGHIEEHKSFITKLRELRGQHTKHSEEAMEILINSINNWIKHHILKDDIALGKFILEKEKAKYSKVPDSI